MDAVIFLYHCYREAIYDIIVALMGYRILLLPVPCAHKNEGKANSP